MLKSTPSAAQFTAIQTAPISATQPARTADMPRHKSKRAVQCFWKGTQRRKTRTYNYGKSIAPIYDPRMRR